jgi:hypothetical protein
VDNFNEAFSEFMWRRLDPELVKDKEHGILFDKIKTADDKESAILDYAGAVEEVAYKSGLKDGVKLATKLEVCANE